MNEMTNSKSQATNHKQIPNFKLQVLTVLNFELWSFEFVWNL